MQVYSGTHGRTMVFTQTKQDADELAVSPCLSQDARVLHGDIVQKQREVTLKVCFVIMAGIAANVYLSIARVVVYEYANQTDTSVLFVVPR